MPTLPPPQVYVRVSSSQTLPANATLVECDTDAGVPLVLTLADAPPHLKRLEVWLGSQPGMPGGVVLIDTQGEAVHGASLLLTLPNEGRVLLWIRPDPLAGGYWRVSSF